MAGVTTLIRTYPVTFWLTTGVLAYAWKASLVATAYNNVYYNFEQQRVKELNEAK